MQISSECCKRKLKEQVGTLTNSVGSVKEYRFDPDGKRQLI